MKRISMGCCGVLAVALGGCAVAPPSGPTVAVMPGQGKNYDQFQIDDAVCRQTASQGGTEAAQQATSSAIGSAVVGTALGAAAGALIGSTGAAVGAGAAIGAGAGLLAGSSVGASGASYSAGALQQRYDFTYAQCMAAKGNQVPQVASAPVMPYGYPYAYAAPYYYGPRYYYPRYYAPYYGYPY